MRVYRLPFILIIFFLMELSSAMADDTPPVDLNKPVSNPELVEALLSHKQENSESSQARLSQALNAANYLVPILTDEMETTPVEPDGKTTIKKESLIKILSAEDSQGRALLPVFTDWQEIKKWTDQSVSTLVMPAAQVWDFVLSQNFTGVVVNPAGLAWGMDKVQISTVAMKKK